MEGKRGCSTEEEKKIRLAEATLWRVECEEYANATVIGQKWTLNAVDRSIIEIYTQAVKDEQNLIKELMK